MLVLFVHQHHLAGKTISFTDNGPLLTMFLDRPVGILALLDEECTFPKATDTSFVGKLEASFRDHRFYKVGVGVGVGVCVCGVCVCV